MFVLFILLFIFIVVNLQEVLNSRQMTDAGPLDLIDDSEDESYDKDISLPGVRKGRIASSKESCQLLRFLSNPCNSCWCYIIWLTAGDRLFLRLGFLM